MMFYFQRLIVIGGWLFFVVEAFAAEVFIPTQQIKSPPDRYYVISIGINEYQDDFWPPLKWPVNDAEKIAKALGNNTSYQRINVSLHNQTATSRHVKKILNDISLDISRRDTVILYWSGHGTLAQDRSGEFVRVAVMYDTMQNNILETGLTHQWLRHWLDNLRANKKMMIFATCHSGVGKSKLPDNVARLIRARKGALTPLADVSEGALILSAAAKNEAAREDDALQGDIYTHFLLKALTLYDRNKDGMVSALEAHDYAKEQTWAYTGGKQRPTADAQLIGDADIPLAGKKQGSGIPILEAYNESMAGFVVKVDDRQKGRLPLAFALQPQGSIVTVYAPGDDIPLARYKVNPGQAEVISLDEVMHSRPVRLAIAYRQYRWQDDIWQSLAGQNKLDQLEFELGWGWRGWQTGINIGFSKNQQQNVRTNLQAETAIQSQHIFIEYNHKMTKLSFGLQGEVGMDRLKLTFNDLVSDSQVTYQDQSEVYGLSLTAKYQIRSDVLLSLYLGRLWAGWSYQDLGDINGNRSFIKLGLHYQFGFKARTLW